LRAVEGSSVRKKAIQGVKKEGFFRGDPTGLHPKKEIGIQKNKKTPFGLKVSVI
jgi:hypothetical protein